MPQHPGAFHVGPNAPSDVIHAPGISAVTAIAAQAVVPRALERTVIPRTNGARIQVARVASRHSQLPFPRAMRGGRAAAESTPTAPSDDD